MQEKLSKVLEEAKAQLAEAQTLAETEEIRIRVLGKKGQLTEILRSMGAGKKHLRGCETSDYADHQ